MTIDGVAQRKAIDRVFAMIASGSPAQVEIGDFYRSDPPSHRAETKTVDVDVTTAFATSDKTYQVEWTETTRGLTGQGPIRGAVEGILHDRGESADGRAPRSRQSARYLRDKRELVPGPLRLHHEVVSGSSNWQRPPLRRNSDRWR